MSGTQTERPITAEEYASLPGAEGGGFMGSVFKYHNDTQVGRRSMKDEYDPQQGWDYYATEPTT